MPGKEQNTAAEKHLFSEETPSCTLRVTKSRDLNMTHSSSEETI